MSDGDTLIITLNGANDAVAKNAPAIYTGEEAGHAQDYFNTVPSDLTASDGTLIVGTSGNDLELFGKSGKDVIFGLRGNDTIDGGNGVDHLFGGSGTDTIRGSLANDLIVGGFGADQLTGGGNADNFLFIDFRDTGDTITDFEEGIDKIAFIGNLGVRWEDITIVEADGYTYINVDVPGGSATEYEMQIRLQGTDFDLDPYDFEFSYAATPGDIF